MLEKSKQEIAFIRELFVAPLFTERFTHIVDEHLTLPTTGKFLYVESGTGAHALEISEKLNDDVEMFGTDAASEAVKIAAGKAAALKAEISFDQSSPLNLNFSDAEFQTIVYDSTAIAPEELAANLPKSLSEIMRVADSEATIAFFLPTAGSYGEFFSVLWEALFNADLLEHAASVEKLIGDLPTVTEVERAAKKAGLKKLQSWTSIEIFDYESATEFLESPLVTEFLMPAWLSILPADVREKVSDQLAQTIDDDRSGMSFRFSIKATLIVGKKG